MNDSVHSENLRDKETGLLKNIKYTYDEFTNLINWKSLINNKYYVPNKQKTQETDITKLQDKDLLILLMGFREVLRIRGFKYVKYPIIQSSAEHCTSVCEIQLISNIENSEPLIFSSIGDANFSNCTSFARNFLGPISENRAFVRCVKNALNINVLGFDEMPIGGIPQQEESSNSLINSPVKILEDLMKSRSITLENIKAKLSKENFEGSEKISSIDQIPNNKILSLIERIKKSKAT